MTTITDCWERQSVFLGVIRVRKIREIVSLYIFCIFNKDYFYDFFF